MPDKEPTDNIRNPILERGDIEYSKWEKIYQEYKNDLNQNQMMEIENIPLNNLYLDLKNQK